MSTDLTTAAPAPAAPLSELSVDGEKQRHVARLAAEERKRAEQRARRELAHHMQAEVEQSLASNASREKSREDFERERSPVP